MPIDSQLTAQIRQLITIIGAILATLGYIRATEWANTALAVLGPIMIILSLAWSIYANLRTSLIASTKAIPEVKGIITHNTIEGRSLANSIPDQTVAPAGTTEAKALATVPPA